MGQTSPNEVLVAMAGNLPRPITVGTPQNTDLQKEDEKRVGQKCCERDTNGDGNCPVHKRHKPGTRVFWVDTDPRQPNHVRIREAIINRNDCPPDEYDIMAVSGAGFVPYRVKARDIFVSYSVETVENTGSSFRDLTDGK